MCIVKSGGLVTCQSYCFFVAFLKVPLGVLLKSETNYEDIVSILEHLCRYVPTKINRRKEY